MPPRSTAPKHLKLSAGLRRLIQTKGLSVGDILPTEQDLCKTYNCSRGTVRRALDTLVSEGIVRRKQGAGHFVSGKIAGKRSALFGLIVPNILNAEVLRLAQRFSLEAVESGCHVVLCVTSEQPSVEQQFIRQLARLRVSGVAKFPTVPEAPGEESRLRGALRARNLPYVIINDFWSDTSREHHVAFDEAVAIEAMVDHLVELGHKHIGWVDGSDGPRRRGLQHLRTALAKHGLNLPDTWTLLCPPYERPPIERLWPDHAAGPTAVITPYDAIAVRLIEALPDLGLSVPEDVSVVNLNGPPFYTTSERDLTTTIPPDAEIVAKALEILTDSRQDRAVCRYLFRPRLHAGRTSAPPRQTWVNHGERGPSQEESARPDEARIHALSESQ